MIKTKGSAIIISMLLVTTVATVAFSIGRLFFIDTSLAYIYENSIIAYYAAESGVEQGYLAYRYNKNIEICPDYDDEVIRINLFSVSNSENCVIKSSDDEIIAHNQMYDLKIIYKNNYYGEDVSGDNKINENDLRNDDYKKYPQFYIPYDESIKIDITDIYNSSGSIDNRKDIIFYFIIDKIRDNCSSSSDFDNPENTFIEAKVMGETAQGFKEQKSAIIAGFSNPLQLGQVIESNISAGFPKVYCLDGILGKIRLTTSAGYFDLYDDNKVELYLKPIGCGIYFGLQPNLDHQIASPFTTITSTGYSGNVSRTLKARIDRQAGTVYDLYDFVILEHN